MEALSSAAIEQEKIEGEQKMRELEQEQAQQVAYLRGQMALLQRRNEELEDGLAERVEQLKAAHEKVRVCEQVKVCAEQENQTGNGGMVRSR